MNKEPRGSRHLKLVFVVAMVFTVATFSTYFLYFNGPVSLDPSDWGSLGDFVGGVLGPLLSLAALLAVLLTIDIQRRELKASVETQRDQSFENTFFQLVRLHNDIVQDTDLWSPKVGTHTRGRDCFRVFSDRLFKKFDAMDVAGAKSPAQAVEAAYEAFYEKHQEEVGHYCRNLYHIFKYLAHAERSDDQRYADLAIAQLSSYELVLLFYNGLSPYGTQFKILAERYALFENLNDDLIFEPRHKSLYDSAAFLAESGADI